MIEITGLESVISAINAIGEKAVRHTGDALYVEGELIMTEAKLRTPVDTGALRNSGVVSQPSISAGGFGGDVEVTLGFGGPAAPYAIHVHEDMEASHKVGGAKYLESAVLEAIPGLAARISERMEL